MKSVERLSTGRKQYKNGSIIPYNLHVAHANDTVTVPAVVTTTYFLFDYQQLLQLHNAELQRSQMTTDLLLSLLSLSLGSAKSLADSADFQAIFSKLDDKFKGKWGSGRENDKDTTIYMKIAESIISGLTNNLARGSVSAALLKTSIDSLTSIDLESLRKLYEETNVNTFLSSLGDAQRLYSLFAQSADINEIATFIMQDMTKSTPMSIAFSLQSLLSIPATVMMPISTTWLIEHIVEQFSGHRFTEIDRKLPNVLSFVTNKTNLEFSVAELVTGYITVLRAVMGVTSTETSTTQSMTELLNHINATQSPPIPFIPGGIGDVKLEAFIKKALPIWLYFLVSRVFNGMMSTTASQIMNIMDDRKYRRVEQFDIIIRRGINVAGMYFDSVLDLGAFFKEVLMSDRIVYDNEDMDKLIIIRKFIDTFSSMYNTFSFSSDNINFLKDSALLVNHKLDPAMITLDVSFDVGQLDSEAHKMKTYIDMNNFNGINLAKSKLIQGYYIDVTTDPRMPMPIYNMLENPDLVTFRRVPQNPLLQNFGNLFKIRQVFKLADIIKMGVFPYIQESVVIVPIVSVQEYSQTFQYPLEEAAKFFVQNKDMSPQLYVDARGINEEMLVFVDEMEYETFTQYSTLGKPGLFNLWHKTTFTRYPAVWTRVVDTGYYNAELGQAILSISEGSSAHKTSPIKPTPSSPANPLVNVYDKLTEQVDTAKPSAVQSSSENVPLSTRDRMDEITQDGVDTPEQKAELEKSREDKKKKKGRKPNSDADGSTPITEE